MKKYTLSQRLKYRFDAMMAKGNVGMIKMLVIATLLAVVVIAVAIYFVSEPEERGLFSSIWDALATAINAWMPSSDDGSAGYIILTAISAIVGLLFTSILIGIITTAVEGKVESLREGNSLVLENGHIVVLGFTHGEYTLFKQLVEAAGSSKTRIVVAAKLPRSEMEGYIRENVKTPKNVRIICRCVDPGDPAELAVCSIGQCRTIVVNQPDDVSTLQATLAARKLINESGAQNVRIVSNSSSESLLLPPPAAKRLGLINISVNDVIARVIARSCTETGLSKVYTELFDIRGFRLALPNFPEKEGADFGSVVRTMRGATAIGVVRGENIMINPEAALSLERDDRIICWTADEGAIRFAADDFPQDETVSFTQPSERDTLVVVGFNPSFRTLIAELPLRPCAITAARVPEDERADLLARAGKREDIDLEFYDGNPENDDALAALLSGTGHVVLLADETVTPDEADMMSILRYIKVNEIKSRFGLRFTVTMELQSERNLALTEVDDSSDLIVAPHIVAMILAQLADRPKLVRVFKELLSIEGSEIHLKRVEQPDSILWGAVRGAMLKQRMIPFGYIKNEEIVLDPAPDETVSGFDRLIVISEK